MSVTHCKRQKQVRVAEDETWDKGRGIVFLDKREAGYILHKVNVTVSTGTGLIFMNLSIQIRKAAWETWINAVKTGNQPCICWMTDENMRQDGLSQDNPDTYGFIDIGSISRLFPVSCRGPNREHTWI